jgi:hypothetical protein
MLEFSLNSGIYDTTFDVTITSSTPGCVLLYTTDGTEPGRINGSYYTKPVTVPVTMTIRAVAMRSYWGDSEIGTATYALLGDLVVKNGTTVVPDGTGTVTLVAEDMTEDIEKTLTLFNFGSSSITITDLTIDATTDAFSYVEPDIKTIPPGFSIPLVLQFSPESHGTFTGTFTVAGTSYSDQSYAFTIKGIALAGHGSSEIDIDMGMTTVGSGVYDLDFGTVSVLTTG